MEDVFNQIPMAKVSRSRFNLSHDVKTTFRMGELTPILCQEVYPGDTFDIELEQMLRFAPLISPVMHRVDVQNFFFFVPLRLLWSFWDEWISGNNPEVSHPYVNLASGVVQPGSIGDYLGYPVDAAIPYDYSPWNMAAYLLTYDTYFRDQNLQNELFSPLIAGDNSSNYSSVVFSAGPLKAAWKHDYFTSCLPFAQKGDPVSLPLTVQDDLEVELSVGSPVSQFMTIEDASGVNQPNEDLRSDSSASLASSALSGNELYLNPNGNYTVDVQSDAVNITTLRRAFRLQEFLEKDARGGTRYSESLLSHFGVRSSDSRLNRPEYLGGSKTTMAISEVLSTAQTEDSSNQVTPLGQMGGHGIGVGSSGKIECYAEEHGVILGLTVVRPLSAYSQGVHRSLTRFDRLDYMWPSFTMIGEQEVLVRELDMQNVADADEAEEVFGYQQRYSELRTAEPRVHGDMRDSLEFWHLGRKFSSVPQLNSAFIECDPSTRIFADDTADHLWCHMFFSMWADRKLPRYAVPTI